MYKLLMRAFPGWYKFNSTYATGIFLAPRARPSPACLSAW